MRSVVVVLLACAAAFLLAGSPTRAQPAPDLDRARALYASAEKALAEARYEEALRDYKGAYEVSRDPALLYKIGVAYEKANLCKFAVSYFAAYLKVGKPTPDFFATTREHIRKCGFDPDALPTNLEDPLAGSGSAGSGSAGSGSAGAGSDVTSGSDAGAGSDAGSADAGAGSGSAAPAPPPPKAKHRAGWILVGGAIAMATVGAVLAYSANAAESDLDDLYVGLGGQPPVFNESTRDRFDDLVAEGKRYQNLSYVSFGVAAVLGGLATWRFVVGREQDEVTVTPTATPTGGGVSARWRF